MFKIKIRKLIVILQFRVDFNIVVFININERMNTREENYKEERGYPEVCTYTIENDEHDDYQQGSC